jgi:alkanesulfonate monooxygenase SsuD/methylene tetrahydromethanopterin reductase-like flavin-dependent oxidoreductase (luciferase family)
MTYSRKLRLGAFMRPVSIHTAAWRYPGAWPDANFNFQHLKRFAQTLERGRFDAFFMADHLAVLNMPMQGLKRSATVTSFDPLTLLPALAVVTEHLGLLPLPLRPITIRTISHGNSPRSIISVGGALAGTW